MKLIGVAAGPSPAPFAAILYGAPFATGKAPMKPTIRLFGLQIVACWLAFGLATVPPLPAAVFINGLSQLITFVFAKSPDGAICANVWSSMNMNSMYGLI